MILFGSLYIPRCDVDVDIDFLLSIGLLDEYEPDVSRDDVGEEAQELSSDSSSVSSSE